MRDFLLLLEEDLEDALRREDRGWYVGDLRSDELEFDLRLEDLRLYFGELPPEGLCLFEDYLRLYDILRLDDLFLDDLEEERPLDEPEEERPLDELEEELPLDLLDLELD